MTKLTITEGLAEIKTIGKRKLSKIEFISQHIARLEKLRDPLEKDGGSADALRRELQAVGDLDQRIIRIRAAIQEANRATTITIISETRSITDWLTWRREIAPGQQSLWRTLRDGIQKIRKEAQQKGMTIGAAAASATVVQGESQAPDVVVNVDEALVAKEVEKIEQQLGDLDGQLSLKNATTFIEI